MGGLACACGIGHINDVVGFGCEIGLGESSEFVFTPCHVSIKQGIFLLVACRWAWLCKAWHSVLAMGLGCLDVLFGCEGGSAAKCGSTEYLLLRLV